MTKSRKTQLASGVIGIGLGLFLSGIILSIAGYQINKEILTISSYKPSDDENIEHHETQADIKDINLKQSEGKKETKIELEDNQIEKEKEIKQEDNAEKVTINISNNATARDIARILTDAGVVSDYDSFLNHIVTNGKARSLIHGVKEFNLNSDNESALKVLTSYK